ncbi:hypothetical protein ACSQ67_022006 [Phaseolus vulgaris]
MLIKRRQQGNAAEVEGRKRKRRLQDFTERERRRRREESEMEESCAMCEKRAVMLCESDQAKLCWECDDKVHGANFLVAKHSRVLLCRSCYSPTPWRASGTKLTPTVSFCQPCVANQHARLHRLVNNVCQHHKEEGENEPPPVSSASATSSPHSASSLSD